MLKVKVDEEMRSKNQLHEMTYSEDYCAYFDQKLALDFDQDTDSLTQKYYEHLREWGHSKKR